MNSCIVRLGQLIANPPQQAGILQLDYRFQSVQGMNVLSNMKYIVQFYAFQPFHRVQCHFQHGNNPNELSQRAPEELK